MKPDTGLASWIRLGLVDGLGAATFRKLLAAFGLPDQILGASHASLSRVVPADLARRKAEQEARLAKALRDNLRRRKAAPPTSDKA